jgi:hypothetical protein
MDRSLIGVLVALVLAMVTLVACAPGGGGEDGPLAVYRREVGATTEETTVYRDGRVLMKHGEYVERFTLPSEDMARLRDALAGPVPTGAPADGYARTLTLPDGTLVEAPLAEAGSATALLELLTDTHSLSEDAPEASHAGGH